ncbi:MAG TPA: SHOCT domain-containing protein, partial [Acidimicrobiia bacterium]|nr:SHOCT domain-containing protein [Acidimicrobiia bacterium]
AIRRPRLHGSARSTPRMKHPTVDGPAPKGRADRSGSVGIERVPPRAETPMLFLYRPRQTWMPFERPRNLMAQDAYNRELQDRYDATRRTAPAPPAGSGTGRDVISTLKDLAHLHDSGALTDEEFATAKAKVLGDGPA